MEIFGFFVATFMTFGVCAGSNKISRSDTQPVSTVKDKPTFKLVDYEPDCDNNTPDFWRCFNYDGLLSYDAECFSDDKKREIYMEYLDPTGDGLADDKKAAIEKELLSELDKNSCNTTQYLECRRISDKVIPGQLPQYRCACPDHEKGDSPDAVTSSQSYFDKKSQMCVLKVGARCANLTIPDDDKRLNGSRRYLTKNMRKVVDGRRQWLRLPCVPNAQCKITQKSSSVKDSDSDGFDDNSGFRIISGKPTTEVDPSKNRCTCKSGFIIEDEKNGKCHPIDGTATGLDGLFKTRSSYPLGVLLLLFVFGVTLWIVVIPDY